MRLYKITKPVPITKEKLEKAQERARKIRALLTQLYDELNRRRNTR